MRYRCSQGSGSRRVNQFSAEGLTSRLLCTTDQPGVLARRMLRGSDRDMLDHLGIDVTDYDRSKAFYAPALAAIGLKC